MHCFLTSYTFFSDVEIYYALYNSKKQFYNFRVLWKELTRKAINLFSRLHFKIDLKLNYQFGWSRKSKKV